ncbi:MAG: hypothetical protein U0X20_13635 [Caldilineaceae bacterium]
MARMRDKRSLALLAAVFGAAGIFVLDLTMPPLIALAGLYVLPMIALVWWGKKRVLYLGAVGCAGLILLGYALVPVRQELPYALVNRLLPIAVLFVFAIAMGRRIDARRELLRQYSRTKRLLDERNAALEAFLAQHRYEDEKTQA